MAPVVAISGVTLIDRLGVETAVAGLAWTLEVDTHRPRLVGLGDMLPTIPHDGSVRIGMLAGYGSEWSDLPKDLAQAALLLAAHFYEFRHATGGSGGEIPFGVSTLIAPYRNVSLFGGGRS